MEHAHTIETVEDIFAALGGNAAVARIIEKGPSAASEMKRRRSIPVEYWPAIVEEGARLGRDDLTFERMVKIMASAAAERRGSTQEAAE